MKYGPTFRKIRLNKNLKLNHIAKDIVSPQFLRKFEKGESDISFNNLLLLLSRLNISVDEFVFICNEEYHILTLEDIELAIDEIAISKDINKWEQLLESTVNNYNLLQTSEVRMNEYIKTIIKVVGNNVFNLAYKINDAPVVSYLEKVESWGKYEFFLANYLSFELDTDKLMVLWRQAFSKKMKSIVLQRYSIDFYLHICFQLLEKSEIELAKQVLIEYEHWQKPKKVLQNLSFSLYTEYIKGIIFMLEKDSRGKAICTNILNFLIRDISFTVYAQRILNRSRKILNDPNFGQELFN